MRTKILFIVLFVLGVKYGYDYLVSDKFENWADKTKEPMTCQFENVLGFLHMTNNEYQSGYYRFSHTVDRCPGTPVAETAEYEMARCLEGMGRNHDAANAFYAFAHNHPTSKSAAIAQRSYDILRGL